MSRENYKRIGDYIRKVDNRNGDLTVTKLLGLSMNKEFRETTSNIVGTDMSVYKIVQQGQFACDFMSPIRVNKLPVVLKTDEEPIIVSPAYPVFEIVDTTMLEPEYLMMWFRRPEFDRYVAFKCDSAIRGGYDWEELCDTLLPVPPIEKQREIVAEYQVIQNRINLNNQLIQTLEATAQAIYKQWFVDFEFPDAEGKPYKTNGGEMVESEMGEVPKGWRVGKLSDVIEVKYGKSYSHLSVGNIPLYGSGGLMGYVNNILYHKPSILIPRKGTLNNIMFLNHPFWCVDTMFYSMLLNEFIGHYLYFFLKKIDFDALNQGSAVPSMTTEYLNSMQIIIPNNCVLERFQKVQDRTQQISELYSKDNKQSENFQELLLSKMAKGE